jgi:hypothetical protein
MKNTTALVDGFFDLIVPTSSAHVTHFQPHDSLTGNYIRVFISEANGPTLRGTAVAVHS